MRFIDSDGNRQFNARLNSEIKNVQCVDTNQMQIKIYQVTENYILLSFLIC